MASFIIRLRKSLLAVVVVVSVSLILYLQFLTLTRRLSPSPESYAGFHFSDGSCDTNRAGRTNISHILFGLASSSKTWQERRHYSELWWDHNTMRGYVWLDENPPVNFSWPEKSPPYRVSQDPASFRRAGEKSPAERIARIVKESFDLGLDDVRWFVMGDDDTVFFAENLVSVLARYDHRQMYYVGGVSESVEQNLRHTYGMGFGGAGFAISSALASELAKILDVCIQRYPNFYGSDERIAAGVRGLGVPVTREHGFHQLDIRGDPFGLLAAHPLAPLVSLHHLDMVSTLFPNQTQLGSLRTLMGAYRVDPGRTLQQSFCHVQNRKWAVSVSWGYTVQLYPSLLSAPELVLPLQTFRTFHSRTDGPFMFNTRPWKSDPCERPVIYFLDQIEVGEGMTWTSYKRAAAELGGKCNQPAYNEAMDVERITVFALKMGSEEWMKAPRRQCCEIESGGNIKRHMRLTVRSCKPGETMAA
ncbi:hypothetical protein Nepgr_017208 [Nepenthes gracilis]|uniref:Uncharacterized protein n=1 Tax=Nepenthes gracilis TaxID=150966 RepID=A0AAD3SQR9_NEPGR|nr:hypothetical protein Nepgr_017208 [Nepenthes gracilis]